MTMASETEHSNSRRERDVARLADLVRDLSSLPNTPEALIREHLDAARFCLQGSMPEEYALDLKLVKQVLPDIDAPRS
jgi:hypothetical protein